MEHIPPPRINTLTTWTDISSLNGPDCFCHWDPWSCYWEKLKKTKKCWNTFDVAMLKKVMQTRGSAAKALLQKYNLAFTQTIRQGWKHNLLGGGNVHIHIDLLFLKTLRIGNLECNLLKAVCLLSTPPCNGACNILDHNAGDKEFKRTAKWEWERSTFSWAFSLFCLDN